ncbi:MAG: hypothetical protein AB4050_14310 [Synechococcus sp.]
MPDWPTLIIGPFFAATVTQNEPLLNHVDFLPVRWSVYPGQFITEGGGMQTTEIDRLLVARLAIVDTDSLLYSIQDMYSFKLVVLLRFV